MVDKENDCREPYRIPIVFIISTLFSIAMIFVICFVIPTMQEAAYNGLPSEVRDSVVGDKIVTILDKSQYTVSQGFFSSRTSFAVVTSGGNYEVGYSSLSGERSTDCYVKWAELKIGHRYAIETDGELLMKATEVKI